MVRLFKKTRECWLDVGCYICSPSRINEGLRKRNLTADQVINIETIDENTVRVWHKHHLVTIKRK